MRGIYKTWGNVTVFRSYWVPDGDGGFDEALLESENGGKVVVTIKHEKKTFKKEQIQQVKEADFSFTS